MFRAGARNFRRMIAGVEYDIEEDSMGQGIWINDSDKTLDEEAEISDNELGSEFESLIE